MKKVLGSRFGLAVQAFLIFILLDLGFFVLGFSRVYRLVRFCGRGSAVAGSARQRRVVDRTRAAVRTATRYYWRRRLDCLPRALTTYVLLRRRGIPATFRIGVKRFPFGAHAWIECGGEVIDDSSGTWLHEPYRPIISTQEQ